MKLYGFSNPTRATRVGWALEEAGADYEYVVASSRDPAYLAINPMGKVPALVDGDLVLAESAACCTWVGTRYPDSGLVPTDPHERARYDMLLSFVTTELEQPMWLKAKQKFAWPREHRCLDVLGGAAWDFDRSVRTLQHLLDGRTYLIGDQFTNADILAAHTLSWAKIAKFDVPADLMDWAKTHFARPSYARAMALGRDVR
jgi:glutathione S-transferase